MKGKKFIELANFNCTFGEQDEPMLEYFTDIVYPAFTSRLRKTNKGGDEFLFENVQLIKTQEGSYTLIGFLVRKTQLEVKSLYEEGVGIKLTDIKYDSDPYSFFAIFLKNHRMIYIRNQKGSPSLISFGSAAKEIMIKYINAKNSNREEDQKLPLPFLNITQIPSNKSIDEQFKEITKIKKVSFRMYPLNGDAHVANMLNTFRSELANVGSKSGNMNINSPKNKEEVANLVKDASDKADILLNTELLNGNTKKFKNKHFSEKISVVLPEHNSIYENSLLAINTIISKPEVSEVSNENDELYQSKLTILHNLHDELNR